MIGFRATAETAGAEAMLRSILAGAADMRPMFHEVVEPYFYGMMEDKFDAEGRPEAWQQLSAKYAAWKAQHYPGRRILEREGLLKEGLTQYPGRYQIRRMGAKEFEIGTSHPAAAFHQYGTRRMPRRKIIDWTPQDDARCEQLAEAWLAKRVKS